MISFDSSIYLVSAVERACADFHNLADIRITLKGKLIFCEISNPRGDLALICDEFSNYVLNLTVMMGGH